MTPAPFRSWSSRVGAAFAAFVMFVSCGCEESALPWTTGLLADGSIEQRAGDGGPLVDLHAIPKVANCGDQSGLSQTSPWPMIGYCPTHQGRSPCRGPQSPRLRWSVSAPSFRGESAVITDENTVVFGTFGGQIVGVDGATGMHRWEFNFASADTLAIARDGTLVGTGRGGTGIYPNGALKWHGMADVHSLSAAVIGPGAIAYAGGQWGLLAVNASTGALQWTYPVQGLAVMNSSAALSADGIIYVGLDPVRQGQDDQLLAFDTGGSLRWSFHGAGGQKISPSIGGDGTVYVGSRSGKFYAIDGHTGTMRWSVPLDRCGGPPTIGLDGTVFVFCHDGALHALDGATGRPRWALPGATSNPVLDVDGTLYLGLAPQAFAAVDSTAGAPKWRLELESPAVATGAIGADGTLYTGALAGPIYAIGP